MHTESGMEFLEFAKFLPTDWTETSQGYHGHINKSKMDQMFLFKKGKWLLTRFMNPSSYHTCRRLQDTTQFFSEDLQSCRQWHELTCNIGSYSSLPLRTTVCATPLQRAEKQLWTRRRNKDQAPNRILHLSAYLPIFWYLHSVPSLSHSTYIILYCSAGKGFSIICNYFLIWPIWEVIAAEKNE